MKSPLLNPLLVILQLQFVIVSLTDDQQIDRRSKLQKKPLFILGGEIKVREGIWKISLIK